MDWTIIISALAGLLTGGGASWLFKIRETKAGSKADVVSTATDAMNKMMLMIDSQQERFNTMIINQQDVIDNYKTLLEESNKKIKELEYKVSESERKLSGMQKIIDTEIKERRIAENNICFVNDCDKRQPKLGTYKKENNGI